MRERADEERKERKAKAKEVKENFKELLEEAELTSRSSYTDFSRFVSYPLNKNKRILIRE